MLAELIRAKTQFHSRVFQAVTVGDIALLFTDFDGTMDDASGNGIQFSQKAIKVLRRQADGTWKLLVGDPNGRESDSVHEEARRERLPYEH